MRLKFGILFFLCIAFLVLPAQAQEFDIFGVEDIKGSVHTIRTESNFYSEVDGKVIMSLDDPWLFLAEVEYDKTKKIVKTQRRGIRACEIDQRKREPLVRDNQIIEFVHKKAGNLEEIIIHTREIGGRIFRSDHFDEEGVIKAQWVYTYEIDQQGNWIKRQAILKLPDHPGEDNIFRMVERRIITYYANQE